MASGKLDASGVYRIRNLHDGKVYIGSAVNFGKRWGLHRWSLNRGRHHSRRLQAAWFMDGSESFAWEIIEYVPDVGLLLEAEQRYIDESRAYDPAFGYNVCPIAGNTLGIACRPETREKISAACRGRKQSPETIARRMATLSEPEHKERMSRWFRSAETRAAVSRTKGGTGYVLTADDVAAAIAQYETGDISIRKLAGEFNVSYQQMRNALHGFGPKFGAERVEIGRIEVGTDYDLVRVKIANSLRKLTDEQVDEMRQFYAAGTHTATHLAVMFNISPAQVSRMMNGRLLCYGGPNRPPIPKPERRITEDSPDHPTRLSYKLRSSAQRAAKEIGMAGGTFCIEQNADGLFRVRKLAPGELPPRRKMPPKAAETRAKLSNSIRIATDETVAEIRKMYAAGGVTLKDLECRFSIKRATLNNIIKGKGRCYALPAEEKTA